MVGAELLSRTGFGFDWVAQNLATATDVLRLAVAMSDGDVSLAEPTKFRSFCRSERRMLLRLTGHSGDPTADMLRWKERWKRLGEKLHPGDYSESLPTFTRRFPYCAGTKSL